MKKYFADLGVLIMLIIMITFLMINDKIDLWEPKDQDDTNDQKSDMYLL